MVILEMKQGGVKTAEIKAPDISEQVVKILAKKYSTDFAKKYAQMVADFFLDNIDFPDNMISKIEDGEFFTYNLMEKAWKRPKLFKKDFVISDESTDFWKEYDKKFGFLKAFRQEIAALILDVTSTMFDKEPDDVRYIEVRKDNVVCNEGADLPIRDVFKDHLADTVIDDFVRDLFISVFGCTENPIFLIKDGFVQCAITSTNIISAYCPNNIRTYIEESFRAEDVKDVIARVLNILVYGIDSPYEILELTSEGNPIYYFCGLKIVDYQTEDAMIGIFMDKPNANRIFEILKNADPEEIEKMKRYNCEVEVQIGDGQNYVSFWFNMDNDNMIYLSNYDPHRYSVAKLGEKGLQQVTMKYSVSEPIEDNEDNDNDVKFVHSISPNFIVAYF